MGELDKNIDNKGEELKDNVEGEKADEDVSSVEKNEGPINKKRALLIGLIAVFILVIIILIRVLNVPPVPTGIPSGNVVDKNELIQNEKRLVGEVRNVTTGSGDAGTIEIKAHILDLNTEDDYIAELDLIYIEQDTVVSFDQQTVFENKKFTDLKAGDVVQIDTTESIYLAESLKAAKVYYYDKRAETIKQILGNTNILSGNIKEITEDSAVITAEVVAVEELEQIDLSGSYSVPFETKDITVQVTADTEFASGSFAELVTGEKVLVITADSIYEGEAEAALEISIISPEPDDGPIDF